LQDGYRHQLRRFPVAVDENRAALLEGRENGMQSLF